MENTSQIHKLIVSILFIYNVHFQIFKTQIKF